MIRTVTILGSGNVATHLAKRFQEIGIDVECIYSRNRNNAKKLAVSLNTDFTDHLDDLPIQSDLYLLSISDDAIDSVFQKLENKVWANAIIAHTSGSTQSFARTFSGVFYPLQTFTKNRDIVFEDIPVLITASDQETQNRLASLASKVSNVTQVIRDEQRLTLHIAAVFVNNFTNHLFAIGDELIKAQEMDDKLLKPLIEETIGKIRDHSPRDIQTGPAKRNDQTTLEKHITALENNPGFQAVYRTLSESILHFYSESNNSKSPESTE